MNPAGAQCRERRQWDPLCAQVPPAPGAAVPAPPAASSPGNPEQVESTTLPMPPVPKANAKRAWD